MPRARVSPLALLPLMLFGRALPLAGQHSPAPGGAACQDSARFEIAELAGEYADFGRLLALTGAAPDRGEVFRRVSGDRVRTFCARADVPWMSELRPPARFGHVSVLPVSVLSEFNSAYPRDANNGALWAGRGVSTAFSAGAEVRWGVLSAALQPTLAYQQNRAFQMAPADFTGYSPYIYPFHGPAIDWPQRFGPGPYWKTDPGQSFVRIDVRGFAAGMSTENLWWGPARLNPIIMSNTAAGFRHVFIGTSRPHDTPIGRVQAEFTWGELQQSPYFSLTSSPQRMFAGMVLGWNPRWLPGLSLGAARVYMDSIPPGGLSLSELFAAYVHPRANIGAPKPNNQLGSFFGRWVLPESGFEAYVEWAREDNWDSTRDLILEPDHSQGYTFGFQKVIPHGARWLRVYGELTHLGSSATLRSGRGAVTFYIHAPIRQGYTQQGQLLGASIGPGSNAQTVGADWYSRTGRTGLALDRIAHDDDAYYNTYAPTYGFHGHDVELTGTLSQFVFLGPLSIDAAVSVSHRYNRDFLDLVGFVIPTATENNLGARLGLSWHPFRPARPVTPTPAPGRSGS